MSPEAGGLDQALAGWLVDEPTLARDELLERARVGRPLLDGGSLVEAVDRAMQRVHGLGPIAGLMADPAVTELMINGPGPVWVDRDGQLEATSLQLSDDEVRLLVDRIIDPLGLRVDRTSPVVDARLPDGSRVNIVVPPLALAGPTITIRRFAARPVPLDAFGPPSLVALLRSLVRARATIVVAGGTGAGKTTLLNALGRELDVAERLIVIEDTSELRLPGEHVVRLEARPPNSEGVGAFTIRQLVRNALRMRPDRLIIGEVRGGEALDLLMALNTGHTGSLTTCHANSCDAALQRLETLALMAEVDLPLEAIRRQLVAAVDVVVHVSRDAVGRRSVTAIAEVEPNGVEARTRQLWPPVEPSPIRRTEVASWS